MKNKLPTNANDLARTVHVISEAIETVQHSYDRRKLDLIRRTEGYRKGAVVELRWIRAAKDLTLQQLFDLACEMKDAQA